MTKLHEEVVRTTLGEALDRYRETPPKGEFVLVVAGAEPVVEEKPTTEDALSRVRDLMNAGLSRKDAVKQTAQELGLPRNQVYEASLQI